MHNEAPIEEVQRELLRVLDWFHNFAEENKIDYFLDGGGLLGFARNGAMIPWDDDLDLFLLREDFEKTIKALANQKLPVGVELHHTTSGNPITGNFFSAKLRLTGFVGAETQRERIGLKYSAAHSGPSLDLVPFDYVSNNKQVAAATMAVGRWLALLHLGDEIDSRRKDIAPKYKMVRFLVKLFPRFVKAKIVRSFAQRLRLESSNHVAPSLGDLYPKYVLETVSLFPTKVELFNGVRVRVPKQPEHVLKALYGGDYLQPPPIQKRNGHFASLRRVVD